MPWNLNQIHTRAFIFLNLPGFDRRIIFCTRHFEFLCLCNLKCDYLLVIQGTFIKIFVMFIVLRNPDTLDE